MGTFEVLIRHADRLKELERRRLRWAKLLAGGKSQAQVAREVEDFGELRHWARSSLRYMQRRSTLISAFGKQAKLF